jgi:two-component system, NtrC family, sensor histidine kinase HydH
MSVGEWTSLAACVGQLGLLFGVLRGRAAASPLVGPLAWLCALLAGWNFCDLAYRLTGDARWHFLDVTLSPLGLPAALQVVLAFSGRSRSARPGLLAAYAAGGALSLSSLSAFAGAAGVAWVDSAAWSLAFLALELVIVGAATVVLLRHLRAVEPGEEQARTRLVLGALLSAAMLGATELWGDLGWHVRPLGNVGTLLAAVLLVRACLSHGLLDRRLRLTEALGALLFAAATAVSYLGLLRALQGQAALLAIGVLSSSAALVAIASSVYAAAQRGRERLASLAQQGRWSEQLAHDLQNPLAALRGGLQFLAEEHARGRSLDAQTHYLALMAAQVERIARVVDDYRRLGRMEPLTSTFDLHALVRQVAALQPFAGGEGPGGASALAVRTELLADSPSCHADPDLVGIALENLLHNAREATSAGGAIVIRTRSVAERGRPQILLAVADEGAGMDARQRERAFDPLFTTKPQGSGLGLAFVKRAAEAQGGSVRLESGVGRGTTVELRLPACAPVAEPPHG